MIPGKVTTNSSQVTADDGLKTKEGTENLTKVILKAQLFEAFLNGTTSSTYLKTH